MGIICKLTPEGPEVSKKQIKTHQLHKSEDLAQARKRLGGE